ncbi:hypothetical protein B0H14DRAFT_471569 [Mycena olivaceomarginata]|nr:hypothetical protein B0H14DRAFT_471569 [Mycena olivaceomarginata]
MSRPLGCPAPAPTSPFLRATGSSKAAGFSRHMSASPGTSCLKTSAARRCVVHTPAEGVVIHICWVQQGTRVERTGKERPCCCYYHRISFALRDEGDADGGRCILRRGSCCPGLSSSRAIFMWRGDGDTVILGALLCLLLFFSFLRTGTGKGGASFVKEGTRGVQWHGVVASGWGGICPVLDAGC